MNFLYEPTEVTPHGIRGVAPPPHAPPPETVPDEPTIRAPSDPNIDPRAKFNRTVPLDARLAQQLMAERGRSSALPAQPAQPAQPSQPSQPSQPTPSQPLLGPVGPASARAPAPAPAPPPPRVLPPRQPQSLTFVMIVLAVALGVFLAGLGLIFVLQRRR